MYNHRAGGEADEAQVQEDNEDVTTKEDAKPDGLVSAYWETIGLWDMLMPAFCLGAAQPENSPCAQGISTEVMLQQQCLRKQIALPTASSICTYEATDKDLVFCLALNQQKRWNFSVPGSAVWVACRQCRRGRCWVGNTLGGLSGPGSRWVPGQLPASALVKGAHPRSSRPGCAPSTAHDTACWYDSSATYHLSFYAYSVSYA